MPGGAVRALGLDDVNQAAQNTLRPDNLIWVVVGDKMQIEPALRALGYGDVYEIDADGNRK
jgi:zinc protease